MAIAISDYDDEACGDALLNYYACLVRAIDGCGDVERFLYDEGQQEQCRDTLYEICPDAAFDY